MIDSKWESIFKSRPLSASIWILLTSLVLYLDYLTGPTIKFPVFVIIPVALSAWYNGRLFSIILSTASIAITGVLYPYVWRNSFTSTESSTESAVNAVINLLIFLLIAFLVDRISRMTAALKKEVKVLEGFLPTCSFCKKIRDKDNNWHSMEEYITDHSEAQFSHGVCPECAQKHYGFTLKDT